LKPGKIDNRLAELMEEHMNLVLSCAGFSRKFYYKGYYFDFSEDLEITSLQEAFEKAEYIIENYL